MSEKYIYEFEVIGDQAANTALNQIATTATNTARALTELAAAWQAVVASFNTAPNVAGLQALGTTATSVARQVASATGQAGAAAAAAGSGQAVNPVAAMAGFGGMPAGGYPANSALSPMHNWGGGQQFTLPTDPRIAYINPAINTVYAQQMMAEQGLRPGQAGYFGWRGSGREDWTGMTPMQPLTYQRYLSPGGDYRSSLSSDPAFGNPYIGPRAAETLFADRMQNFPYYDLLYPSRGSSIVRPGGGSGPVDPYALLPTPDELRGAPGTSAYSRRILSERYENDVLRQRKSRLFSPGLDPDAGEFDDFTDVFNAQGKRTQSTRVATRMVDGNLRATTELTTYTDAAEKADKATDTFQRRLGYMAQWMAFIGVLGLVTKSFGEWMQITAAMDSQITQFKMTVDSSSGAVEKYVAQVMQLSKQTGVGPSEIGPGVLLQERLGTSPELTAEAARWQKITGIDNVTVQRNLMSLQDQFGVGDPARISDAIWGAMSKSSITDPKQFFQMAGTAGPLAKQFGMGMDVFGLLAGSSTVMPESPEQIELFWRQMNRIYTDGDIRGRTEQIIGRPTMGINTDTGAEVRTPMVEIMRSLSSQPASVRTDFANQFPSLLGQKTPQMLSAILEKWGERIEPAMAGGPEGMSQDIEKVFNDSIAGRKSIALASVERAVATGTGANLQKGFWTGVSDTMDNGWRVSAPGNAMYAMMTPEQRWEYLGQGGQAPILGGLFQAYRRQADGTLETEEQRTTRMMGGRIARGEVQAFTPYDEVNYRPGGSGTTGANGNLISLAPVVGGSRGLAGTGLVSLLYEQMVQEAIQSLPDYEKPGSPYQKSDGTPMDRKVLSKLAGLDIDDEGRSLILTADGLKEVQISAQNLPEVLAKVADYMRRLELAAPNPEDPRYQDGYQTEAVDPNDPKGIERRNSLAGYNRITVDTDASKMTTQQITKLQAQTEAEMAKWKETIIANVIRVRPELEKLLPDEEAFMRAAGYTKEYALAVDATGTPLFTVATYGNQAAIALGNVAAAVVHIATINVPTELGPGGVKTYTDWIGQGATQYQNMVDKAQREAGYQGPEMLLPPSQSQPYKTMMIDQRTGQYVQKEFPTYDAYLYGVGQAGIKSSDAVSAINTGKSAGTKAFNEQQAIMERIAKSIEGFTEGLLKPTEVTEADAIQDEYARKGEGNLGPSADRWDEPVRRVRAAVNARKAGKGGKELEDNWAQYAREQGIDLSNPATAVVTGAEYERKFYSGLLPKEAYAGSRDAFVASAQRKIEEMKGQDALKGQAMGWLKDAGITGELADYLAKDFAGEISPLQKMLFGDKPPKQAAADLAPVMGELGKALQGDIFPDDEKALALAFEDAFKSDKMKAAVIGVGKNLGVFLMDGMKETFVNGLAPMVADAALKSVKLALGVK